MPHLHLFFPENDLALAADTARYTAPPIVVKLRRAGATLPLWYGKPGDFVMTEGINAQWFDRIKSTFRLSVDPFSQYSSDMTPAPWGWSIASRRFFEINGVPASVLPIDQSLSEIRQLSHRRTAARIATLIQETIPTALAPVAHECSSVNEVRDIVTRLGRAVIKLPWSSSGRGVIPVEAKDFDKQEKSVEGMIRRQGSSPKTVYVPTEKHFWHTDTLTRYITATDSVTVIERVYESDTRYDSIAPILDSLNRVIGWDRYHFRGRTKMMEAECQRLMAVIDSLRNVKADTVREKIRVPYPVERKLTRWERTKMELGGWAFGALIVAVIAVVIMWLIYKKRRK